jgi:hypothetical protein
LLVYILKNGKRSFLRKLLLVFAKKYHNIVFLINANFFAENWRKSPKKLRSYYRQLIRAHLPGRQGDVRHRLQAGGPLGADVAAPPGQFGLGSGNLFPENRDRGLRRSFGASLRPFLASPLGAKFDPRDEVVPQG